MPSSEMDVLRFQRNPANDKLDALRIGVLGGEYRILWATPLGGADQRGLNFRIRGAEKKAPEKKGVIIHDRQAFLREFEKLFPVEFSSIRQISDSQLQEVYLLEQRGKPVGQVKFDFDPDKTLRSFSFSKAP
jgi:hypothetical protein